MKTQTDPGWFRLLTPIFLCILSGCDGSNLGRASAHGKVTFDGQPIDNGSIQFAPTEDNRGPVAGGIIENSQYSIERAGGPVVGKNLVKIAGSRKTGKKAKTVTGEMIEEYAPVVPEQFQYDSKLVVEVKPGDNELDFELQSK